MLGAGLSHLPNNTEDGGQELKFVLGSKNMEGPLGFP